EARSPWVPGRTWFLRAGPPTEEVTMLQRLGIRSKVLAVIALPMIVVFGLAAYLSVQVLDDVRRANAIDDLTVMLGRYGAVVDALQDERRVSRDLSRRVEINGARKATNEQLELLEEAIETLDYDLLDPALRDIV